MSCLVLFPMPSFYSIQVTYAFSSFEISKASSSVFLRGSSPAVQPGGEAKSFLLSQSSTRPKNQKRGAAAHARVAAAL